MAEKIGRFRGVSMLADYHLFEFSHRLAVVSITPPKDYHKRVLDLCDPDVLAEHRIRPDHVAAKDVNVSQAVSRQIYEAGFSGIRWWSSFFGEWHTVVLFLDRVRPASLAAETPTPLTLSHWDVRAAAALGIRLP